MATSGIISIVKDNKVLFKCVAGCNSQVTHKVAKIIEDTKKHDIKSLYKLCLQHGFGCDMCLVVQSETTYKYIDMTDPLDELYYSKFNDPYFNPRWSVGTAPYVQIIEI